MSDQGLTRASRLEGRTLLLARITLAGVALACAAWSLRDGGPAGPEIVGVVAGLALLLAPRWPLVAVALGLVDYGLNGLTPALIFASVILTALIRLRPWLALLGVATVAFVIGLLRDPAVWAALRDALGLVVLPGLIGLVARGRTDQAELRQQRDLERLRAVELDRRNADIAARLQIAQELHDGLGHKLSLIVLGLSGLDGLIPAGDTRARGLLQEIQTTGRDAMTELRQTVLSSREQPTHDEGGAQDGLATIVDRARRAGLDVTLGDVSPAPLDPATQQLVERVVTEAVTNVTKHAAGAATVISTETSPDGDLVVDVTNGRAASDAPEMAGSGTGLTTLREAMTAAGGLLEAGPTPDGGYRLQATFHRSTNSTEVLDAHDPAR